MRVGSGAFRLGVWLATSSLSFTAMAPALAQPAPPDADPPAIAGRLAQVTGAVSFHTAADQSWVAASQNYPVTAGDGVWTEPQATAAIEIGADRVVLDGSTELEIGALDQQQFAVTEAQGAMFLELTDLPAGQSVTINTPRAAVQITAAGQYEIVAGDTDDATSVTVVAGAAHIAGNGVSLDVGAQQTASITGADSFQGGVGPMQQDGFLQAQLRLLAPPAADVPRQVQCMTGGAELARYGAWSQSSQYGQVWYPRSVPAGWAPYRAGHWAYVAPWGWNWVDDQPWGFAPFHYGRWVDEGGRWGWVAAAQDAPYEPYPTYAPALVSFVDVGGAALAGFAAGALIGGAIGWVPLGFREPYYPSYHVSEGYLQRINRISVVNVRNITINNYRNIEVNRFANARAATVMPARAMARSERVAGIGRPLGAAGLVGARPLAGRAPISLAPVRVARPAPGPQFRGGDGPAGRPALRRAAPPPNVAPGPRGPGLSAPGFRAPGLNAPGLNAREPRPNDGAGRPGLPPLRQPGGGRPPVPVRAAAPERRGLNSPTAVMPAPQPARAGAEAPARPPHVVPPADTAPHRIPPAERQPAPERRAPETRAPANRAPANRAPAEPRAQPAHREPAMPRVERPSSPVARPSFHQEARPQPPRPRPEARPEPRPEPRPQAPRPAQPHPEARPHPAPPGEKKH